MSTSFVEQENLKIWCNDFNNAMFKALMSALLLDAHQWQKSDNAEGAQLWCLINYDEADKRFIDHLIYKYSALNLPPKVICLGRKFTVPPISSWVFFKSPVNVSALHKWLNAQNFISTQSNLEYLEEENKTNQNSSINQDVATSSLWLQQPFKLQYWPNVTQYTDSPEIMLLCSKMLRDWVTYEQLQTSSLASSIIDQLLEDAEIEGNLIYQTVTDQASPDQHLTSPQTQLKTQEKDSGWGFFKNLLNRFVS